MIIDMRLRPATPPYLASTMSISNWTSTYHERFGVPKAPSVKAESMELCLMEMDEAKIDLGCCPARWGRSADPIVPAEEVVRVMEEYDGRFYGAIAINANYTERSLLLIEQFVIHGSVKAVCMEPCGCGEPMHIDDQRCFPIYEYLQENNIPLFLMAGGFTGPDLSYTNPVHLNRVLNIFKKMTVIDIHASVPWVDEAIFCAVRNPNLFLCPDMYLINTPFADRYIQAANCLIQDQFLFGTSYPYIPFKDYMDIWNKFPINDSVIDKIMYKNAIRALNLDFDKIQRFPC